ncbi:VHS1114 protein [Vibrio phage 1]|nr:VHS1114 protein [Vibrio phage 1]
MLEIKRLNEHRPVGVKINCPTCNEQITKARYNTNFCSNKGAGNCKDAFYQATQGDRHKKG